MPFVKVPKGCQNGPVGFQSLNNLGANADSFKAELALEHVPEPHSSIEGVTGDRGAAWGPLTFGAAIAYGAAGGHDTDFVARGTAVVLPAAASALLVTSTSVQLTAVSGVLQSMQVLATGRYFFPIDGWSELWGKATARTVAGSERVMADARVFPVSGGLVVRTFLRQDNGTGNEMLDYHTGFYLVAFGRKAAVAAAGGAMLRPPSRFARGPMQWFPSRAK